MIKIIAFDSWTGGAKNFERLVKSFKKYGATLMLIHIGSWGHDRARSQEELIGGLLVRDISFYGSMSFKQILMHENPDAVLFLSMQAFAHKAFNRYCIALGIPTVHLYHGIINVQSINGARSSPVNASAKFKLIIDRVSKNLFKLWPVYLKSIFLTSGGFSDYLWFIRDVCRQVTGQIDIGRAAPDTKTTACCVYTSIDIDHAVFRYGLDRQSVYPVGNPDLITFGLSSKDIGFTLLGCRSNSNTVVYIDTALIKTGSVYDDENDFISHILESSNSLSLSGLSLIVKLHPTHFNSGLDKKLIRQGIKICTDKDFIDILKKSFAVIVEPSTLAIVPAILGLPLLLARFGKLSGLEYGEALENYPFSISLSNISELLYCVKHIDFESNHACFNDWIDQNIGPQPFENMPDRVFNVFYELLQLKFNNY